MDKSFILPELEKDAIFLPASQRKSSKSIHGCNNELYVLYYNNDANCRNGCFEIQIISKEVLKKYLQHQKMIIIHFFRNCRFSVKAGM